MPLAIIFSRMISKLVYSLLNLLNELQTGILNYLLDMNLVSHMFIFLVMYLFLDRGEEREKERERNINVWLPLVGPLLGTWPTTQACALTGNLNRQPLPHFGSQASTQSTEPHQPGLTCFLKATSSILNSIFSHKSVPFFKISLSVIYVISHIASQVRDLRTIFDHSLSYKFHIQSVSESWSFSLSVAQAPLRLFLIITWLETLWLINLYIN